MKKIFDIGMFDGADTAYYLECGYHVVAVEANPALIEGALRRFQAQIAAGQLTLVHAAISSSGEDVDLILCGQDLGSSSIFRDRIAHKRPSVAITVPGVTLHRLFELHGMPEYLKVDIEGADRLCVLALTADTRPTFLSFEVGDDVDELLLHVAAIGFRRFKIINQNSFRELANHRCWYDRIAHRLMRTLGYSDPRLVRRAGRFFATDHSSGPAPWQSDGRWWSIDSIQSRLRETRKAKRLSDWYDIHASV